MTSHTSLIALPTEILQRIPYLLDGFTLTQLALSCRRLFNLFTVLTHLWKYHYDIDFPSRPEEHEWLDWYRERYQQSHWAQHTKHLHDEFDKNIYWFWRYFSRISLQERWLRSTYTLHQIQLPISYMIEHIQILVTNPWRTLLIYHPNQQHFQSNIGTSLYSLEHSDLHFHQLHHYSHIHSSHYPRILCNKDYTVLWSIYDVDQCISWIWNSSDHGQPLDIPILKHRKCIPITLVNHLLLVGEVSKRTGYEYQSFHIVNLSHFHTFKRSNHGGYLTVNIPEGYTTCHLHYSNEHTWQIYTGKRRHQDGCFYWEIREIQLAKLNRKQHVISQGKLIHQGVIVEPRGLDYASSYITSYSISKELVLLDWNASSCHYSLQNLELNQFTHELHVSEDDSNMIWYASSMPNRRFLSTSCSIEEDDELLQVISKPNYLWRVLGSLRLSSMNGHHWYLIDQNTHHIEQMRLKPIKSRWQIGYQPEVGDKQQVDTIHKSTITNCNEFHYQIVWKLPKKVDQLCMTHLCHIEYGNGEEKTAYLNILDFANMMYI